MILILKLPAILLIYLMQKLKYNEDTATIIFHLSLMSVYLCSLLGAAIADSVLGKFRTIFYLSIVYVIGSLIITVGSVEVWNLPARDFTIIGLALVAIGSGGIKPCVSAFGGEQFELPDQAEKLEKFFSIFYFIINFGSALSLFITPLLRTSSCFGMKECYVAAFGLPALLMIVAVIVFMSGRSKYRIVEPQSNMIVQVSNCITVSSKYCLDLDLNLLFDRTQSPRNAERDQQIENLTGSIIRKESSGRNL